MKKIYVVLLLIFTSVNLFSIPGVQDIMPTESGEYIYYRDYTFTTETYIGFLQYDEGTYSIRYYAPNPGAGSSEIELLISLDPEQDYVLMTGERIVSKVTMDDNTTINYLHDMFYEFASRRKKITFPIEDSLNTKALSNTLQQSKVLKNEDYYQYGGEVSIEYDYAIPIFNLRSITNNGEKLLEVVTMGRLIEQTDTSFWKFKGFPVLPEKSQDNSLKQNNIDSLWTENETNFYFIENDALLYSYDIEIGADFFEGQKYGVYNYLSRELSLSNPPSFIFLPEQSMYEENNSLVISNVVYLPESNTYTKDTKIINHKSENTSLYTLTALNAFYAYYFANEEYFKKKIKSFTE